MIITKQKSLDDIILSLEGSRNIFLVGCELCATICRTGGSTEISNIKEKLNSLGFTIKGSAILDPACNILEVKRLVRSNKEIFNDCDAVLSFTCGGGTQAISSILEDIPVLPGNDTLFQGEITKRDLKRSVFSQKCSLCGDCMLGLTGGICPVTRCAKGLVNGPCGGVKDKKCEVSNERDCVWVVIYEKLKKFNKLDNLRKIRYPKDHRKSGKPQNHVVG